MKKRLAFLTAALALVCMVQAQPFRFGGNGEFTVMQLTDLHYNGAGWQSDHIPGMLVRLIDSEKPDLVVLDVMLPGVDGIELLQRMKASAELRTIPVVMATAKGAEYDKIQSLDLEPTTIW